MSIRRVRSDMRPSVRSFQPFANCIEQETLYSIERPRIQSTCANRAPIWEWRAVAWATVS